MSEYQKKEIFLIPQHAREKSACNETCQRIKEYGVEPTSVWLLMGKMIETLDSYELNQEQKTRIIALFEESLEKLTDLPTIKTKEDLGEKTLSKIKKILKEKEKAEIAQKQADIQKILQMSQQFALQMFKIIKAPGVEQATNEAQAQIIEELSSNDPKNTNVIHVVQATFKTILDEIQKAKQKCQKVTQQFIDTQAKISGIEKKKEKLQRQAITDELTQVFNRTYLEETLPKYIQNFLQGKETGENAAFSLAFIDLDNFKTINDEHGHDAGDRVLKKTAKIIGETCRKKDKVVRFGGDEFVLLLPGADSEVAHKITERIQTELKHQNLLLNISILIQASIGICELKIEWKDLSAEELGINEPSEKGKDTPSIEELGDSITGKMGLKLLKSADKAMYQSKKSGKGQIIIYQED